MTTIMAKKKKKKGRPSLLDLQKRSLKQQLLLQKQQNPNLFESSTNPRGSSELIAGDEDDERKEKKHKLVLGFNSNSDSIPSTFLLSDDSPVSIKRRKISDVGSNHLSQKVLIATDNSVGHGLQVESGPTTPLPDKKLLVFILDRLQKKDTYGVFSEPVDPEELPDYHEIIANPMDFGTVRHKLDRGAYSTLEQFENDILLICSNAMEYNSADTVYFRQARSIQELAKKDFENLREESDDGEDSPPPPKIIRRGRPPGKKSKKLTETSPFEYVGLESFSDAAPTLARDNSNGSSAYNLRKGPIPNKFRSSYGLNGIFHGSFGSETCPNWVYEWENEFPTSVVKSVLKYGSKRFAVDDNKRDTYLIPDKGTTSTLTLLDSKQKHLVEVGDPYLEYSYTRSLVQFTAGLGPVVREIALKKIESILPVEVPQNENDTRNTTDDLKSGFLNQSAFGPNPIRGFKNQSELGSLNSYARTPFQIQHNSVIQPCSNVSNSNHVSFIQSQMGLTPQPDTLIRRTTQGEALARSQMNGASYRASEEVREASKQLRETQHSQMDSQVFFPSDMNVVGFQAPCSPSSVVQIGSPQQPDLALQLRMGW